jgi:predicted ester cyclase
MIIEEVIAEGNHVVVRWLVEGTHGGPLLGIPATGRPVRVRGMSWLRYGDDRLVEGWVNSSLGTQMHRLAQPAEDPAPHARELPARRTAGAARRPHPVREQGGLAPMVPEVWNQKQSGAIHRMLGADCVAHLEQGILIGPDEFAELHASVLAGIPDINFIIEDSLAEGTMSSCDGSARERTSARSWACRPPAPRSGSAG